MSRGFSDVHPVVSLGYFLAVLGFSMFTNVWWLILLSIIFAAGLLVRLAGMGALKHALLICIPIAVFTMGLEPLFVHKGQTTLYTAFGHSVQLESVLYGTVTTGIFLSVVLWFGCFSKVMGSEKLLFLLGRFLPSIGLILSMAFRFIPLLRRRHHEIVLCSQEVQGKGKSRSRRFFERMSILISWSMEQSMATADTMRARGYGSQKRSCYHRYRFTVRDGVLLGWTLLLCSIVAWFFIQGAAQGSYFPGVVMPQSPPGFALGYGMLLATPVLLELGEGVRWKYCVSKM